MVDVASVPLMDDVEGEEEGMGRGWGCDVGAAKYSGDLVVIILRHCTDTLQH